MRKLIILMFISASVARGGFERTEAGGRAQGLAGAYTALSGDAWGMFFNPAGLARLGSAEAGFFLSPRPFGFSELSFSAATAAVPVPFGVIGIAGSRYGFSLYREESVSLSFGVQTSLGDVGATLVRYAVSVSNYGSASAYGVNAGYSVELESAFRMGFRIRNLNAPALGAGGERLRESAAMGLAFQPAGEFLVTADLLKEPGFDPSLRAGAEIVVASAFLVRLGVTDQPSEFHAGIGVRAGFASFDYAFSLHEDLGPTHECSLSIRWGGGGHE